MTRPRLATVWLDGCSGCHMSFLDMDERLLELAERVDLVYSPLVDTKEFPEDVDVSLVEGRSAARKTWTRSEVIRERTPILVSFGDCAVTGNVPGMRNPFGAVPLLERAYLENATATRRSRPRSCRALLPSRAAGPRGGQGRRVRPRLPAVGRPHLLRARRAAGGTHAGHRAHRPLRRLNGGRAMAREIIIDPVTRIEGHAKITIQLDDDGQVADAHFHVTQFRGFEKFCEGRPSTRCRRSWPASAASARSATCRLGQGLRRDPGRRASRRPPLDLRRIMNLAQIVQSHALSFFHLSSPDLLLGMDADPAQRNLFGVLGANPQLARDGIRLRQFGQQIIESLGGKRIHPAGSCPAASRSPLDAETRDRSWPICPRPTPPPGGRSTGTRSGAALAEEATAVRQLPVLHGAGRPRRRRGALRRHRCGWSTPTGRCWPSGLDPRPYWEYLGEAVEPWSYLKSAY